MNNPPVTIGIDPAAPNGDHSAMAVIQGNTIHSVIFNDMAELEKRAAKALAFGKLYPYDTQKSAMGTPSLDPRYTYYLLRQMEVIATDAGNHDLPAFLHTQGQHGDVLVTRSYLGKYRAYFWAGKKKHYWRRVDSRKYPDLIPQLRAALLLQT